MQADDAREAAGFARKRQKSEEGDAEPAYARWTLAKDAARARGPPGGSQRREWCMSCVQTWITRGESVASELMVKCKQ